jgi:ribosomal protein S7
MSAKRMTASDDLVPEPVAVLVVAEWNLCPRHELRIASVGGRSPSTDVDGRRRQCSLTEQIALDQALADSLRAVAERPPP